MPEGKLTSLADLVYERVERDILTGVYQRGDALVEIKLSKELAVSRTPVREAIRRLEQDDLVESRGKGVVVVGVTQQDVLDMMEVRARLEGLVTAKCCTQIQPEALATLDEIVMLQEFYANRGLPDRILEADSRFHETICTLCGSRVLGRQLTAVQKRLTRYRKVSVSDGGRARESIQEHRRIYHALECRNAEEAEQAALAHVNGARRRILEREVMLPGV